MGLFLRLIETEGAVLQVDSIHLMQTMNKTYSKLSLPATSAMLFEEEVVKFAAVSVPVLMM